MAAKADRESKREFKCKYCGEIIIVNCKWNKSEIMCGSCGQFIDLKFDNNKNDENEKDKNMKNENKKLSKHKSDNYQNGRIAIVPKTKTDKLGGKIVKLPSLTGIDNVQREINDKKKAKKKKADK